MLKYSFLPVFSCLLGALAWWSNYLGAAGVVNVPTEIHLTQDGTSSTQLRREIVEALDRVVAYQHYYHSVHGHFTKLINKIGFSVPPSVLENYEVRVSEATADRLIVTAFSEAHGKIVDLVTINQDFKVHANFQLPPPRSTYLKNQAIKYMRLAKNSPSGQILSEQGVYKEYFQYSIKDDSRRGKSIFAIGVRPPVVGVQLELNDSSSGNEPQYFDSALAEGYFEGVQTGQQSGGNVSHLQEETQLAQTIFLGEMGRYAKSWAELSKIANFRFDGNETFDALLIEKEPVHETNRKISSVSSYSELEIEPLEEGYSN
jgi:hypothetical protein